MYYCDSRCATYSNHSLVLSGTCSAQLQIFHHDRPRRNAKKTSGHGRRSHASQSIGRYPSSPQSLSVCRHRCELIAASLTDRITQLSQTVCTQFTVSFLSTFLQRVNREPSVCVCVCIQARASVRKFPRQCPTHN